MPCTNHRQSAGQHAHTTSEQQPGSAMYPKYIIHITHGLQVSVRWMQYLDSIRKEAKIIVVGSPTAGIAEDDTAAVSTLNYI